MEPERKLKIRNQIKKLPIPMKSSNGIAKNAVLYIFRPESNVTCEHCVFVEGNKCKIFGPDDTISPVTGSCGFYIHGHQKDIPWIGTITKEEAGYIENKTGFQCKRCEEFNAVDRSCKKVDKDSVGDTPGMIHPNACCNRWEMDEVRGKMTEEQLDKYLMIGK